jgi:hypothetical protein
VSVTAPNVHSGIDAVLSKGGQISGKVTAATTNAALVGVYVQIYTSGGNSVTYAYTDANGNYITAGLISGNYKLKFDPGSSSTPGVNAYLMEYYSNKLDLATANQVSVTVSNVHSGINAELAKGGQISGKVTAATTNAPLQGVYVQIYTSGGNSVTYAYTDAAGNYITPGMKSGDYRVKFDTSSNSDPAVSAYLEEYYSNKADLATANPVNVAVSSVQSGIDAVLAKGGQISGKVIAATSNAPLQSVYVGVYTSGGSSVAYTYTDGAGNYTTPGMTTGNYRVLFEPSSSNPTYAREYYDDKLDLATSTPVSVTAPNIHSGINATLAKGSQISGTVTQADTLAVFANVSVNIYDANGLYLYSASTDSNGKYTLRAVPTGSYKIGFAPPSGSTYVSEYYDNMPTLNTATLISVTAPTPKTGINAALGH